MDGDRSYRVRIRGSAMVALLVSLVTISFAQATIVPIGPFVGGLSETWESRDNHVTPSFHFEPNPTTIMGGAATIGSTAMMAIYENPSPNANFFIGFPSVSAQVSDGTKGLAIGSSNATTTITFDTPVLDFGAYWATGASSNGFTIRLLDERSGLLAPPEFVSYTRHGGFGGDGGLDWHGWNSTNTAIKSVSFRGDFVAIDGLQAIPIPEPLKGDFDMDNDADGFDFLKWQRGESPDPLSQSDLADWETNNGAVAPLSATSAAVPEPSTWIMLMLGLGMTAVRPASRAR